MPDKTPEKTKAKKPEPSRSHKIQELELAGWDRISSVLWKAPADSGLSGNFLGPRGAWKAMKLAQTAPEAKPVCTFRITRNPGETWREVVIRVSEKCGMMLECLDTFDLGVKEGREEGSCAWFALYEWDCMPFSIEKNDKKENKQKKGEEKA